MSFRTPPTAASRRSRRRRTILGAALVLVSAVLVGAVQVGAGLLAVLGYPSSAALSSSPTANPVAVRPAESPRRDDHRPPGEPGVTVPDGATVFTDDTPAVTRLDPELLRALRRAATDAAGDGVEFHVNSGWRSRKDQERLFRAAVADHGSTAEAARWVARPGTSAHESGDAVDLGPTATTSWLSRHGAGYGLCQIYGNEPWHYELRPKAVDHGCPPVYADPTQDPRMR